MTVLKEVENFTYFTKRNVDNFICFLANLYLILHYETYLETFKQVGVWYPF